MNSFWVGLAAGAVAGLVVTRLLFPDVDAMTQGRKTAIGPPLSSGVRLLLASAISREPNDSGSAGSKGYLP
jgi:hypothetical protein